MKKTSEFGYLIPLISSGVPFILFAGYLWLPDTILMEDLAKFGLMVWLFKARGILKKEYIAALSGLMFGLSETALYMLDLSQLSSLRPLVLRLVMTTPMHVVTMVLMYVGLKMGGIKVFLMFLVAIGIHLCFNLFLVQ